jgi:23S rRNA (uracil1939-C5)-methyltransferase
MASLTRGSKLKLHIDRLSVGGRGVGRSDALVVFVADVCEARLIQVLKASSERVVPPCPVAGICGGCNWQHISYAEQLVVKRDLVRESLRKFSGFDVSGEDRVQPVVASPRPFRYRNRIQLHHTPGVIGYYKRGSHSLVSIDDCPISEEKIAKEIPKLRATLPGSGRLEVYVAEDETVHTRGGGLPGEDDEGGLSFAFSQVNTQQNRNLVSAVVSTFMTKLIDADAPIIFDLYAGSGNFSFALAKAFPDSNLTAVELNEESVGRAREKTAQSFSEQTIRWVQSDVGAFLAREVLPKGAGVLLDPPRAGCDPEIVSKLAKSSLAFIAYVSCHPVTLSRDLKTFNESGWILESVQPFDMFPQTDHVETLAVLTRPPSV